MRVFAHTRDANGNRRLYSGANFHKIFQGFHRWESKSGTFEFNGFVDLSSGGTFYSPFFFLSFFFNFGLFTTVTLNFWGSVPWQKRSSYFLYSRSPVATPNLFFVTIASPLLTLRNNSRQCCQHTRDDAKSHRGWLSLYLAKSYLVSGELHFFPSPGTLFEKTIFFFFF